MATIRLLGAAAAAALFATATAEAATIQVGPGQTYATPCAAIAAAAPGDEIDVSAGTYTDTCEINAAGLLLKGVGGKPTINVTGVTPADEKGIYVVNGDNVTIENLELTGAAISDAEGGNGAGLRIQSNGVTVTGCYIHGNQDGILATATTGGTGTHDHPEHGAREQRTRRRLRRGFLRAPTCLHRHGSGRGLWEAHLPVQLGPRARDRHRGQGAPAQVARAGERHPLQPDHGRDRAR